MTENVGRHALPPERIVRLRPSIQQAAWWQRIPASGPLVFGLISGILLGFGSEWWLSAALLALGLTAATRRWWLIGLVLLAGGVGYVREQSWEHAPDPLARYVGGTLTLSGHWDGQFLSLQDPAAKVALSPKPPGPPGELRVTGVLVKPPGVRIPGGFDYAFWLRAQGVHELLAGAAVKSSVPEGGVRGWFRRGLAAGLGTQQAALMTAVELGDKNAISNETFDNGNADADSVQAAFTRAGLAHLMALSGQNVALLTGVLALLFIRTPLGRIGLARYPVMIVLLGAFLWLVGPSPSITRAVLMGAAVLAGQWFGRGRLDVYGVLALTALVGLAAQPAWLFDVGFVLSYLAVLGLTLSNWAAGRLPPSWPEWIRFPLVATVLAEAATLPVVAGSFHQLPLTGLPANLLAEGVMAALVPLGFLAGLLGPLGFMPNLLNAWLLSALLWIAHTFGQAPVLSWGQIGTAGFAAYAVFAAAGVLWLTRRVRLWALALTALLCMLGTALPARLQAPREVVYLDVGQGDSTLIRAGALRMLIDGGGTPRGDYDVGAKTVVPALHALGVNALDVVVATHADADHIEGLVSVLKLLPVGELWIGQRKTGEPLLSELIDVAGLKHIPVREVRRGDGVQSGDISLTVLWPKGAPWSRSVMVVKQLSPALTGSV
ncbi:ComEC/Rec2 family competence protein [Deinococcus ruber]|uniref:DNA internalization-related competence protein ComEC/Rec2 n=1 Tax=Deinococcus ruber TaxID=1848197 RepID=A0A918FHI5_9DEIO|nr:ComEC/Rec2 family competence protein [Deinococcus ruber]GGR37992.1 DNA internalization-related competence protein ComEC/Rec2 [Deinococcus ruber]